MSDQFRVDEQDGTGSAERISIEGRKQTLVKVINQVSANASNGLIYSQWFSCAGYDRLGISGLFYNESTNMGITISVDFSQDQLNPITGKTITDVTGSNSGSGETPVVAPYYRIVMKNKDTTGARIGDAWALLKD